jgi:hypothetical protein
MPETRGKGRPPKTDEEKRETKRIYMKKYQTDRYKKDNDYKNMKKEKAKLYYHKVISVF